MRKKDDHCCKASKYPLAEPGDPLVVVAPFHQPEASLQPPED